MKKYKFFKNMQESRSCYARAVLCSGYKLSLDGMTFYIDGERGAYYATEETTGAKVTGYHKTIEQVKNAVKERIPEIIKMRDGGIMEAMANRLRYNIENHNFNIYSYNSFVEYSRGPKGATGRRRK